jgi:hypothetical protein
MQNTILPYLSLILATTAAFKVTLFDSLDCTGTKTKDIGEIEPSNGCQKVGDIKGSVKIEWTSDRDNPLLFTTYQGDKCCVPYFHKTLIWQDECLTLESDQSFRVVDPDKIEKGKEGEDYDCSDLPENLKPKPPAAR